MLYVFFLCLGHKGHSLVQFNQHLRFVDIFGKQIAGNLQWRWSKVRLREVWYGIGIGQNLSVLNCCSLAFSSLSWRQLFIEVVVQRKDSHSRSASARGVCLSGEAVKKVKRRPGHEYCTSPQQSAPWMQITTEADKPLSFFILQAPDSFFSYGFSFLFNLVAAISVIWVHRQSWWAISSRQCKQHAITLANSGWPFM